MTNVRMITSLLFLCYLVSWCTATHSFNEKLQRRQDKTSNSKMARILADKGPAPMDMPMPTKATSSKLQQNAERNSTRGQQTKFADNMSASKCESTYVRRPWSKATKAQRQGFLEAQHCLMHTPGKWDRGGHKSNSLWDDLVLLHHALAGVIHGSAILPPAHRILVNTQWWLMTKKCKYTGEFYYFDVWTYGDQNEVFTTPDLWSEDYMGSFKGSGTPGYFKDQMVHFQGSMKNASLIRTVNRPLKKALNTINQEGIPYIHFMTSDYVKELLKKKDYWAWEQLMETTIHQYMHSGHGGDIRPFTSPNAPFFWQIHSCVDALWAMWQEQDGGKNRLSYFGKRWDRSTASAHDSIPMMGTWSIDFNVEDVLDIRTKPNCYSYEWIGINP